MKSTTPSKSRYDWREKSCLIFGKASQFYYRLHGEVFFACVLPGPHFCLLRLVVFVLGSASYFSGAKCATRVYPIWRLEARIWIAFSCWVHEVRRKTRWWLSRAVVVWLFEFHGVMPYHYESDVSGRVYMKDKSAQEVVNFPSVFFVLKHWDWPKILSP